ncbi:MAG: HYR domain-containing protein, partial [Chloroflexi bacterium]|nr:HYR domain-containing protein [Chloroflexota bacterium]
SANFTVTVQDTTPPTVTVPANITAEATGPSGEVVTYAASASDLVSGVLTPTCAPASGSTFPLGTTTVTCSATDGAGNTGSANFTVTVQDTTPPTITKSPAGGSYVVPAGGSLSVSVTTTDIVGVASCSYTINGGSPVSPGSCASFTVTLAASGTYTLVVTATDGAGNVATLDPDYIVIGVNGPFAPLVKQGLGTGQFKAGSTIPVKFTLTHTDYDTEATGTVCISTSTASCTTTGVVAFRYDATSAQYIANVKTTGLSAGTYYILLNVTGATNGPYLMATVTLK